MKEKENKESVKNKIANSKFIQKIKNIKHIEYIVVGIMLVVVCFILFSSFGGNTTKKETKPTSADYAIELETKLSKVLSEVKGAGKVSVMVTLESGSEIKIAYTTEDKKNGTSEILSETPVLINKDGQMVPVVLVEYKPKILGVIVVAAGANDIAVKLNLQRAAQVVLKIQLSCIEIFEGK